MMQHLRSELDALKWSQLAAPPLDGTSDSAPAKSTESAPAGFTFGGDGVTSDGTVNPPFCPTQKREKSASGQTETVNYMSVTMMPEYQHKSFDELRFEHYNQGTRPAQAPMPSSSKLDTCTPEDAPVGDETATSTAAQRAAHTSSTHPRRA